MVEALIEHEMLLKAQEGMRNAYSVIHNIPVGAAVLTRRGNIYQGCNTESVISGMGVCAERSAIDHAVACGEYLFQAVLITSALSNPLQPCGMCLQYMAEFSQVSDEDIIIIMVGASGSTVRSTVRQMLPGAIGPRDLGLDLSRYRR